MAKYVDVCRPNHSTEVVTERWGVTSPHPASYAPVSERKLANVFKRQSEKTSNDNHIVQPANISMGEFNKKYSQSLFTRR